MSGITDGTHEYGHELDDQELMRRRDVCLALARTYPDWAHNPDLIEEYISEAEHQDGYAYWTDNFYEDNTLQSRKLFEDIQLYAENVLDAEFYAAQMQEHEAAQLGKVDLPGAGDDRELLKELAQSVYDALDADFEKMDNMVWIRLQADPDLRPYWNAWQAAIAAEKSGEMSGGEFDLYMDWFSDAVRAPMLDQIALEVFAEAIKLAVLSTTTELKHHYVPIRTWGEFKVD
jgi:hypothetical protein